MKSILKDANAYLIKGYERSLFLYLKQNLNWQAEYIKMFGKTVLCPRKVCWYSDPGIDYRYSGKIHIGSGWDKKLKNISKKIQDDFSISFNSVLGNYYVSGKDYQGWHRDNEPELGPNPTIASLSFGASREFLFRHKQSKQVISLLLEDGDLLIMAEETQKCWEHSLPKRLKVKGERINLSFRFINKIV